MLQHTYQSLPKTNHSPYTILLGKYLTGHINTQLLITLAIKLYTFYRLLTEVSPYIQNIVFFLTFKNMLLHLSKYNINNA